MKLRQVFGLVLIIVAVVLVAAVLSGFQLYSGAVEDKNQESLQTTADSTATQLDALLAERTRIVELQATNQDVRNIEDISQQALERFVATTQYQGLSVVDADGTMVAIESTGISDDTRQELIGSDFSEREYVQRALSGETFISEPFEGETGNLIVVVSTPIERNGEIQGTLNAALHLDSGEFFQSITPEADTQMAIEVTAGTATLFTAGSWEQDDLLTATASLSSTEWEVRVAQSEARMSDQAQSVPLLQITAIAIVLVTLGIFALWFRRSSLRQIDSLLEGFDQLADREYGTQITLSGPQEWREIGNRFNEVSTELARHERELTQYRRAIEEATDLICVIDTEKRYLLTNPQYRQYHGIESDDQSLTVEDVLDPAEFATTEPFMERAFGGKEVGYKTTRTHPSRGERTLDMRYYPLEVSGEVTGAVCVLRDITEREERAQQIRVVDRVLRHNLRNDLTVIGLEAERIGSGSSGTIKQAAEKILEKSDGLLTTSDKSRKITEVLSDEPDLKTIDVSELLRQTIDSVGDSHPDATISLDTTGTQSARVTTYFQNALTELIENAIVHNDSESPIVTISVESDEETVVVKISDPGPGIPEMDRDVLETGRKTEDLYHGSGLGLWMVYWVVQRSGGSISVHTTDDRGTVVSVRVPLVDE